MSFNELPPAPSLPSPDQFVPSHFAIEVTVSRMVPLLLRCHMDPPTYISVPFTKMALTYIYDASSAPSPAPLLPRADQLVPFHFAIASACRTPPALLNQPPT